MNWVVAATGLGLFVVVPSVRWIITEAFVRMVCPWTSTELRMIASMLPRGVAVAVMAFIPISAGISDTELFPVYALSVIALSVLYITVALAVERRLTTNLAVPVPTS